MRILDRYIIRQFLRNYVAYALFFAAIFLLTELFTSVGSIGEDTQLLKVVTYYLLKIPSLFILLSPLSAVISGLFTASHLGSTNQLQAIQVSGVSMRRALLPLFLVGVVISLAVVFADNTVVYQANKKGIEIRRESLAGVSEPVIQDNVFIAVPPGYVFYIRSLDVEQETMSDVLICEYGEQPRIVFASHGHRAEGGWVLTDGKAHTLSEEPNSTAFSSFFLPVDKAASYFSQSYFPPSEMSFFRLQQLIAEYRASGFDARSLEMELQTKLAYPFGTLVLIVAALALGVILRRGRGASLAVGLLMGFGYYQLAAFTKSLGVTSVVSPIFVAWLPNLLFLAVGVYLVYRMD